MLGSNWCNRSYSGDQEHRTDMFDRYTISPSTDHHHYHRSEITERRAPTDESVRLLREMQQAAEKEVIKALSVRGNSFNALVHSVRVPLSATIKFLVVYELNGNRYSVPIEFDDYTPTEKVIQGVIDELSRHIAINILQDPFSKTLNEMTRGLI